MPVLEKIVCDYCDRGAILIFEDVGATHYVCSSEHYHLYYERKYQDLIKLNHYQNLQGGLKILAKVANNPA